jgi:hypothetical protein
MIMACVAAPAAAGEPLIGVGGSQSLAMRADGSVCQSAAQCTAH